MHHGLPDVVSRRLGPGGRFGVRETLGGVAVAIVGIPFALLLQQVTTHGPLTVFDERVAEWLHTRIVHKPVAIDAMRAISFTGTALFLVVLVGLPAGWALRRGARKLAAFLVVTSIGGAILDALVKLAVGRPRPKLVDPVATALGKSFPSGHSMSSLICYGAVLLVLLPLISPRRRNLALAATTLWVALIGLSRLALGVHFLSDVLGGFALGAAWLIGSVAAFEIWRIDLGQRPTHPLEEGVDPEEAQELTS